MDSTHDDLPDDLDACHALIRALQKDREQEQEARRQQEETIVQQQETIDRLMADLALLKRSLFGSRRERFIDDPRQGLLFDSTELDSDNKAIVPEAEAEGAT